MVKIEHMQRGMAAIIVLLSLVAAYGLGSWAIDSGSILVYALSFTSIYVAIRAAGQTIKRKAHDNSTKNRRTKKA